MTAEVDITEKRCDVCGAPRNYFLHFGLKNYTERCQVCEKAQTIKTLPDLRIQAERESIPTEEECLVRSIKYNQGIGPKWSEQFDDKDSKEEYVISPFKETVGNTPPLKRYRSLTREEIADRKYKYYDTYENNKQVRKELPRYMSHEEAEQWIKIHEPMDEEY